MTFDAVVLAAGDFPRKGTKAWDLLESSRRVVACDGAVNAYVRRFRSFPCAVVGDMDSVRHPRQIAEGCRFVKIDEQDTNDLEKAVSFCRDSGWRRIAVVGATGRREDHTLGNLFRIFDRRCVAFTDHGVFFPVDGRCSFRTRKGAAVSVFATDPSTRMTSRGLKWPLDNVRFENLFCATLNRSTALRITLTSDRPAYVFIES